MAALEDLKQYMTTTLAGKYTDSVLSGVIEVESSDQGNRVRPAYRLTDLDDWSDHPSPLREAIMRRSCRNLAMRKSPLGIKEGEVENLRIVGRDSEIARLEAPYKRLAVG